MKEKEETAINPADILEQAATDYYNKWRFVGGTVIKPAFLDGANFMSTQMYTREQVEKMLSALRQRCAEACDSMELSPRSHQNKVEAIQVHQFIPPLNDK